KFSNQKALCTHAHTFKSAGHPSVLLNDSFHHFIRASCVTQSGLRQYEGQFSLLCVSFRGLLHLLHSKGLHSSSLPNMISINFKHVLTFYGAEFKSPYIFIGQSHLVLMPPSHNLIMCSFRYIPFLSHFDILSNSFKPDF
ncbi:unnamed protein product, partial [Hymenolepis diminuta]